MATFDVLVDSESPGISPRRAWKRERRSSLRFLSRKFRRSSVESSESELAGEERGDEDDDDDTSSLALLPKCSISCSSWSESGEGAA